MPNHILNFRHKLHSNLDVKQSVVANHPRTERCNTAGYIKTKIVLFSDKEGFMRKIFQKIVSIKSRLHHRTCTRCISMRKYYHYSRNRS